MGLTRDDWATAYGRLQRVAKDLNSVCRVLYTKNVGGPEEVEDGNGAAPKSEKERDCSGKILIRKLPSRPDENIETRIVVVGNGKADPFL